MTDFSKLKKASGNLDKLSKAIQAIGNTDLPNRPENFWKPEVNKEGNGLATIRFLPAPPQDGDDGLPWVKIFSHGFQGPGGWLIDNCLTTKNKQCPICEHNKVAGYQNYDKSGFEEAGPLLDDDEELEKIWKSEHSLLELVADKEFKSYDDLKARLDKVLGSTDVPASSVSIESMETPKPKAKPVEVDITDDDDMAYFAKLADD